VLLRNASFASSHQSTGAFLREALAEGCFDGAWIVFDCGSGAGADMFGGLEDASSHCVCVCILCKDGAAESKLSCVFS